MKNLNNWITEESKRLAPANCKNVRARLNELLRLTDEQIGKNEAEVDNYLINRIAELEEELSLKIVEFENVKNAEDMGVDVFGDSNFISKECDLIECRVIILKTARAQLAYAPRPK